MSNPLDNMEIANGKSEQPFDLDYLFGAKQTNPFKTTSREDFLTRLERMPYFEMQGLAQKVGIDAFSGPARLRQNLLCAFDEYCQVNKYKTPPPKLPQNSFDVTNPQHRKLMAELGMTV